MAARKDYSKISRKDKKTTSIRGNVIEVERAKKMSGTSTVQELFDFLVSRYVWGLLKFDNDVSVSSNIDNVQKPAPPLTINQKTQWIKPNYDDGEMDYKYFVDRIKKVDDADSHSEFMLDMESSDVLAGWEKTKLKELLSLKLTTFM